MVEVEDERDLVEKVWFVARLAAMRAMRVERVVRQAAVQVLFARAR